MDWKLEVVTVPVSDVDRSKAFYADKTGFVVDLDTRIGDASRLVRLTPPGSACSIHLYTGITEAATGSVQGLHRAISDVEAARRTRRTRGRSHRGSALRVGQMGVGAGPGASLLRLLQRPSWQRLGRARASRPRLTGKDR